MSSDVGVVLGWAGLFVAGSVAASCDIANHAIATDDSGKRPPNVCTGLHLSPRRGVLRFESPGGPCPGEFYRGILPAAARL
jgi:hypothetical protein